MMNELYKLVDVGFCNIYVHAKDPGISRALMKYNKNKNKWPREPEFMEIASKEINHGDVVLDIGANIGFMTSFFSTLNNGSKIYALEPDQSNFELIKKNVEHLGLEKSVHVENLAVSDEDGHVNLNISASSNLHSIHNVENGNSVRIRSTSITSFLRDKEPPSFLKMDVEGAEVEILNGMREYAEKTSHEMKILIEVHPNYYSEGHSFNDELQWYARHGFYVKYLVTATVSRPDYFVNKRMTPIEEYEQGGYSRGIYENLDLNDVIEAINNIKPQKFTPPTRSNKVLSYFGLPNRDSTTTKIVRGILLVRDGQ